MTTSPLAAERAARSILVVRGERVMLDVDLAALYGVEAKALNRAVKRNADRFPENFCHQLPEAEWANLRSQCGTSSSAWGGRRHPPYSLTGHGVIAAAFVLNSAAAGLAAHERTPKEATHG